jgi:hypothetical protein
MNAPEKAEIRELTGSELEQLTGGASMTEYALLLMAVLTATIESGKK